MIFNRLAEKFKEYTDNQKEKIEELEKKIEELENRIDGFEKSDKYFWLCDKSNKDYDLMREKLIDLIKSEKPKYKEKDNSCIYTFKNGTYIEKTFNCGWNYFTTYYYGDVKDIGAIPEKLATEMWDLVEKLWKRDKK